MKQNETQLGRMTRREFRQRMRGGELKCCLMPIAAVEQHLEHLAMEQDWRSVNHVAEAVADRLAPQVIVAQALMAGVSEHHMSHVGTLSMQPGTFLNVLSDLIDSMVRAGFERIVVLNGHGGNVAVCESCWDQLLRRHRVNLHFLSYWEMLTQQDAQELLTSGDRFPEDLPGHAQEFETAFARAIFPENIREEAVTDQPDPTPAMATSESGQELVVRIIDRLTNYVQEVIEGGRTAQIPPYFP